MNIYNMVNGYNPACIFFLPMLGKKESEYPRFRDCFLSDDGKRIVIYTRVGGGNRNSGFGEDALYEDPNFVKTYDDDYDSTYGYYEFSVPEKWISDFDKIVECRLNEVSDEYFTYLSEFYPKLAQEGVLTELFRSGSVD